MDLFSVYMLSVPESKSKGSIRLLTPAEVESKRSKFQAEIVSLLTDARLEFVRSFGSSWFS